MGMDLSINRSGCLNIAENSQTSPVNIMCMFLLLFKIYALRSLIEFSRLRLSFRDAIAVSLFCYYMSHNFIQIVRVKFHLNGIIHFISVIHFYYFILYKTKNTQMIIVFNNHIINKFYN